jgi:hypothetical protein
MSDVTAAPILRRPRFRRAEKPIPFRFTDGDLAILRAVERYRFVRSTHIAALVGRSIDRTNDRLCHLYHAGYVERPRAQLDYYPTAGSAPMVYTLADRGARLLVENGVEVSNRPNSKGTETAGRAYIEHKLEIVEFSVAVELATRRHGIPLFHADQLIRAFPEQTRAMRNPLALRAAVPNSGKTQEIGIVPDLAFGLGRPDGSRRCFLVEIDRGTMPITRSAASQTSFERKMLGYLTAYGAGQHEQQFGWKSFRVLAVTTDKKRLGSMIKALQSASVPQCPGPPLFWFALRDELSRTDPIAQLWRYPYGEDRACAGPFGRPGRACLNTHISCVGQYRAGAGGS